ncbi:MAG: glycoside hydrolase family 20 zincin-like fold domain-containing protein, partial [Anaerolineae bacterium]|nr:glycoside hydrolase family 20 zincin-like fold domain-containing protein [Anaerolineae bacterium]
MLVFPQPQNVESLGKMLVLAEKGIIRCQLILNDDAEPLEQAAARVVADALETIAGIRPPTAGTPGAHPVSVFIGGAASKIEDVNAALAETPVNPDAYVLLARTDQIALLGRSPAGTLYAAQTLKQLLQEDTEGNVICEGLRIVDWPDYRHRGIYIESKWGPDLMELQDWKDMIDYMASLKFNSLGIGVYCCWGVQYEGKRTEFLMIPFPDHPELQTPKTIKYYSPKDKDW